MSGLAAEPLSNARIAVEWPARTEVHRSDYLRLSLYLPDGTGCIPPLVTPTGGRQRQTAIPVPVGTPAVGLGAAFGLRYEAFATATLDAVGFEVKPEKIEPQSLNQACVSWEWNMTPKSAGQQTVNLAIQIEWRPLSGAAGQGITRVIWRNRAQIRVNQFFITTGQLSLASVMTGIIGSFLTVPSAYVMTKEFRASRRKQSRAPDIDLPRT